MESNTNNTNQWRAYFDAHKKVWYDPNIPMGVKALVRLLELHRSDSQGWSLSIRKISKHLGISTNTALKTVNDALSRGVIETNNTQQRKRRKLKLSVSLRAPVEHKKLSPQNLSQKLKQPVSPVDTESVSTTETVNNKENLQTANTEKSQVKPKEKFEESIPYKEGVPQGLPNSSVRGEPKGMASMRELVERLRKENAERNT